MLCVLILAGGCETEPPAPEPIAVGQKLQRYVEQRQQEIQEWVDADRREREEVEKQKAADRQREEDERASARAKRWEEVTAEYNRLWAVRHESFNRGLKAGMSVYEIREVWGQSDDAHQSVVGSTHYGTLIYRWHGENKWSNSPVNTYHLDFIDGKLSSYHEF